MPVGALELLYFFMGGGGRMCIVAGNDFSRLFCALVEPTLLLCRPGRDVADGFCRGLGEVVVSPVLKAGNVLD